MRVDMGRPGSVDGLRGIAVGITLVAGLASCQMAPADRRPSILLFVLDTTRADAVSAYGRVSGTTPEIDALAAAGLRYTRAYAQAPWTFPSHATLFTGLLPSQHGLGWRRTRAPDSLVTLAELLNDAGYETVALVENPWLTKPFNLMQGFEHLQATSGAGPDMLRWLDGWLRDRPRERPFFLFVNVIDPHAPYSVREENPFLPPGTDTATAGLVPQKPEHYMCLPDREPGLEILWDLYLGEVSMADAKLRRVRKLLQKAKLDRDLVTIATSDHGEHFGEHGLVSHQFSVLEALIRVPLVIHGIPGIAPAVIDEPVRLADVVPTVLRWAELAPPDDLPGTALPTAPREVDARRPIIAEYDDPNGIPADEPLGRLLRFLFMGRLENLRANCGPDDKVFGDMQMLLRYPHKVVSFSKYPTDLYDLEADPDENQNLAPARPRLTAKLIAELERHVQKASSASSPEEAAGAMTPVPPDVLERLRTLGYVDGNDDPSVATERAP